MNKALLKTEREFIDRMGQISKRWGMSEPVGRVWGTMLFSDKPLSQKEIAEKTGYTLSLVSPSLNRIVELDMARSVRGKNKERLYEITTSFIEGFRILIRRFLVQDIKPLIEKLENTKGAKEQQNLSKLVSDYKKLEFYLNLFENMRFDKNCKCNIKKLLG